MPEIAGVEVAEALVVRPGDILMVRVDPSMSRDRLQDLVEAIRARLSEDVQVLIIAAEQLAVFRG